MKLSAILLLLAAAFTIAAPVGTESTEGKTSPSTISPCHEDIDLELETASGVGAKGPTPLFEF